MGELLGALGLAWPRLLIYPGGLFALAAAWLLWRWLRWASAGRTANLEPEPGIGSRGGLILAAVPPLAVLCLLPLAPARGFPYGLDLVIALALLEAPRLAGRGPGSVRAAASGRAGLLRDYLAALVAMLGMAEAVGGLELTRLLRLPEPPLARALLGVAALLWVTGLPRLIERGPGGLPGRLRALGLLSVAALPALGAMAAAELLPGELAGWVLPPAALLLAGLALGGAAHLGEQARERVALALGAATLALLALGEFVARAG